MLARILLAPVISLVAITSPAAAQVGAQVPEGSNLTLFALGALGLIVGRRVAMKKRQDHDRD